MKFKVGDKICHRHWPENVFEVDQASAGWYHLRHLDGVSCVGLGEFDANRDWHHALNGVEYMLELV